MNSLMHACMHGEHVGNTDIDSSLARLIKIINVYIAINVYRRVSIYLLVGCALGTKI